MMGETLKQSMARWDAMDPAERDALVATEVMGWFMGRMGANYWEDSAQTKLAKRVSDWHPTTDRNDCAEAESAFKLKAPEAVYSRYDSRLCCLAVGVDDSWMNSHSITRLLDPSDVCRAMLEALAAIV